MRLRNIGVVRRDPRIPIRLTDWVKDRINKRGKYELIIDHRIRKRFPQHHISRQRIPRGKYSKQKKEEYKRKEERIKVAILRFAASRGISRYRCLMNGAVWPVIELPFRRELIARPTQYVRRNQSRNQPLVAVVPRNQP